MRDNDALKYETKNWLARRLIRAFQKKIKKILSNIDYKSLHEVGCGQGYNLRLLNSIKKAEISGSDISEEALALARKLVPEAELTAASVYELPFSDSSFDLVVASEVLEHLEDPERGLKEIKRISRRYCLFTAPNEPLWRILNFIRGKYWKTWGNPPVHLNHWSKIDFVKLASRYFEIIKAETSLPWIIVLGHKDEQENQNNFN